MGNLPKLFPAVISLPTQAQTPPQCRFCCAHPHLRTRAQSQFHPRAQTPTGTTRMHPHAHTHSILHHTHTCTVHPQRFPPRQSPSPPVFHPNLLRHSPSPCRTVVNSDIRITHTRFTPATAAMRYLCAITHAHSAATSTAATSDTTALTTPLAATLAATAVITARPLPAPPPPPLPPPP